MRVVNNTLDTLSKGRGPVPLKGPSGCSLLQITPKIISEKWNCLDEVSLRILDAILGGGIPNTTAALKSVLHRLMWFRSIGELILQFRREDPIVDSFLAESLIKNFERTRTWPYDSVVKWIKYFGVALHVRFLYPQTWKIELPEFPPGFENYTGSWFNPLGGFVGRWISQRLISSGCRTSQRFFYGFLQTKRGCRTMDDDDILESFQKHAKALSKLPTEIDEERKIWYKQKCQLLFKGFRVVEPESVEYELSHNSCTDASRSKGGSLAAVQKLLCSHPCQNDVVAGTLEVLSEVFRDENPNDCSQILLRFLDDGLDVTGISTFLSKREKWDGLEEDIKCLPPIHYPMLREMALFESSTRGPEAVVAAVLEPLKVRLVTKGNALTYSASMPLQKAMHGFLKKKPIFKLIGEPLTTDHLCELEKGPLYEHFIGCDDFFWKSGDYSAATDTLNIEVTKLIFETWMENLDCPYFLEIGRAALYEHKISYPKLKGKEVPSPFMQTTGQLMGSTLSFPVLCVANLLSFWKAAERYCNEVFDFLPDVKTSKQKFVTIKSLPVKINGDDIFFPSNTKFEQIWKEEISALGFSESAGKSVKHKELIYLNSKQYRYNGPGSWEELPFFNVGVLLGKERVVKLGPDMKKESERPADVSSWHNSLLKGSVRREAATCRFLELHKEEIRRQTDNGLFNLFASPVVCGLGFELPSDTFTFEYTKFQRFFGHCRLETFLNKVSVRKPRALGWESSQKGGNPDFKAPGFFGLILKTENEDAMGKFFLKNPLWCPSLEIESDISQNRDIERFTRYRSGVEPETETFTFKRPRRKEIKDLYGQDYWNVERLASNRRLQISTELITCVPCWRPT